MNQDAGFKVNDWSSYLSAMSHLAVASEIGLYASNYDVCSDLEKQMEAYRVECVRRGINHLQAEELEGWDG